MKTIKHILVVTPAFPEDMEQGIVVPCLQLYIKELRNKYSDLTISVVPIHFPFSSLPYSWQGVNVYPLNAHNGNILARPLVWMKGLAIVKTLNKQLPIDLIHSFWYDEATFLAQRFSQSLGIQHIATYMGQDAKKTNRYRRLINSKKLITVALSTFHQNVIKQQQDKEIQAIIPFGISRFDQDISFTKKEERDIDLLCVSSLIPLKQVHLFVELVARLYTQFPTLKTAIVGEGPLLKTLQNQIQSLGLEQNIVLIGKLERNKCILQMSRSRILVHTSMYESQGYVLNEALSVGCHVVTLSKSLCIQSYHYTIAKDNQELFDKTSDLLYNDRLEHSPDIPIRMEDTLLAYEKLLQMNGMSFK